MRYLMASVVALSAIAVSVGAASACEWYKTQAMASATPAPAPEQPQTVAATKVDPHLIAWLEKLSKEVAPPVASDVTPAK
jgi:hypothetical protein